MFNDIIFDSGLMVLYAQLAAMTALALLAGYGALYVLAGTAELLARHIKLNRNHDNERTTSMAI